MIQYLRKRNGEIVPFQLNKVMIAMKKAFDATRVCYDEKILLSLCKQIAYKLEKLDVELPTVEFVQDIVEETLIENAYVKVAKAYIIYRQERIKQRNFYQDNTLVESIFESGFKKGNAFFRKPQSITSYLGMTSTYLCENEKCSLIHDFDFYCAKGVELSYVKTYFRNLRKCFALFDLSSSLLETLFSLDKKPSLMNDEYDQLETELLKDYVEEACLLKIKSFVKDETLKDVNEETCQALEGFLHNINALNHSFNLSIEYGLDCSPYAYIVIDHLLKLTSKGLGKGEMPQSPIQIFLLKEGINKRNHDPYYSFYQRALKIPCIQIKEITD